MKEIRILKKDQIYPIVAFLPILNKIQVFKEEKAIKKIVKSHNVLQPIKKYWTGKQQESVIHTKM